MTTATGKRHPGATGKVLEYLRHNMNITIPYREIEKALELPSATISNSVGYLIDKGLPVTRPMQGTVMLSSGATRVDINSTGITAYGKSRDLFEYVGQIQAGQVLLRDEKETLWVAIPMAEYIQSNRA